MYLYDEKDLMIEMLEQRRKEVLKALLYISKKDFVEDFAKIFHYSWQDNLPEAEKLAETLNLFPIDFCAIARDLDGFSEYYREEMEEKNAEYLSDYLYG